MWTGSLFLFYHPKNTANSESCPIDDALWKWNWPLILVELKTNSIDGQYKFRTCQRTSSQTRPNLLPDATEPAPRRDRICSQTRLHLLPRSLNGIGLELTPLLPFCQTILSSLNFKRVSQQRLTRKSCWRKDTKKPANIRPQVSILSLFALCVNN